MTLQPHAAGRLLVCLFAVLTAAKEVAAGSLARNLNVCLVVVVAFLTACLFFHAVRLWHRPRGGAAPRPPRKWGEVAALNVSSVAAWGTIFYALQYIEPAIASALAVATLPLFTLVLQRVLTREERVYRCDLWASLAISLSVVFLGWQTRDAPLAAGGAGGVEVLLAVLACLLCALGMAVSNLIARRLYVSGWTPADVMAHRFYLLIAAAGALLLGQGVDLGQQLGQHGSTLVAFALLGVAMPVLVLQFGVKLAPPVEVATIIALSPMLVLLFQLGDPEVPFDAVTAVGVLATVAVVASYLIASHRARTRAAQTT